MKINCKACDLLDLIEPACYVASKAMIKTNPYNDLITISVNDNEIGLLAFNGMVSISTQVKDTELDYEDFSVKGKEIVTVHSSNFIKNVQSFNSNEELIVELINDKSQKELRISKKTDLEEFQAVPCLNEDIELPTYSEDDISKELTIDKDTFVSSANKVNFALGFEDKFLYWVLRTAGKKVRFAAGDNRRFAILDVDGDGFLKSKNKTCNIMFPKEHTTILLKLLAKAKDSTFKICESSGKKNSLFYQAITFDNHSMIFSHVDPNVQWPDENKVLAKEIKTKFIVDSSDWETVSKAVDAAFDGTEIDQNKAEIVSLRTDFKEKVLHVEVNENHKISRKIPILDYESETDEDLEFKVVALYLKEIFNKGEKDGKYQFEFGDLIEDVNGNKFLGPFFVRYFAGEKVGDKADIKFVDTATNWLYKFLFIILPSK